MPPSHATLVLASASPARLATLRAAGVRPTVLVSSVDEDAAVATARAVGGELSPADVALLLARAKAEDVAAAVAAGSGDTEQPASGDTEQPASGSDHAADAGALVLGCDSVLELDGEVHGKPADAAQAVARWRRMRGGTGVLHTGHWLVDGRSAAAGGTRGATGATASTTVHFADLSDDEIAAYVATGEPLRVAGAFTIDGLGGPFVSAVEGDPGTVVGLSLPLLRELLLELGVPWFDLLAP
jgi:septum formation protein